MPDERMILIQALCIEAPVGFCERIGVAELKDSTNAWVLSRRETRMLTALIRAEKERGEIVIQSNPQLTCLDNQTGLVQVGQEVPVITKVESEEKNGRMITKTTTESRNVGLMLRVTPRGSPDGKSILLRVEAEHAAIADGLSLRLHNGGIARGLESQAVRVSVSVPDSGTAVIRGGWPRSADGKQHELIWVLTAQMLKAPPAVQPPATRPAPVMPPAPRKPVPVPPLLSDIPYIGRLFLRADTPPQPTPLPILPPAPQR
jgi:hypothetical protein